MVSFGNALRIHALSVGGACLILMFMFSIDAALHGGIVWLNFNHFGENIPEVIGLGLSVLCYLYLLVYTAVNDNE